MAILGSMLYDMHTRLFVMAIGSSLLTLSLAFRTFAALTITKQHQFTTTMERESGNETSRFVANTVKDSAKQRALPTLALPGTRRNIFSRALRDSATLQP